MGCRQCKLAYHKMLLWTWKQTWFFFIIAFNLRKKSLHVYWFRTTYAQVIDDLNILEATMEAMRRCTKDVRHQQEKQLKKPKKSGEDMVREKLGQEDLQDFFFFGRTVTLQILSRIWSFATVNFQVFVAIDGNRLPKDIDADSNVNAEAVSSAQV